MARARRPYWMPYSVVNWGICNLMLAMMFELAMYNSELGWSRHFPLTMALLAAHGALAVLYFLGRAAIVGVNGAPRWRQARLPEPGEPEPGNRLAWPAPDGLAARVATPTARALTRKTRPAPRDLGKAPDSVFTVPVFAFMGAVILSVAAGAASLVFPMPWAPGFIGLLFFLWGVSVWGSITAAIVLKTRRLNEDA